MFGFGKKEKDVRLTDKELKKLTEDMNKQERRDFNKRQKQMENDRIWRELEAESFWD